MSKATLQAVPMDVEIDDAGPHGQSKADLRQLSWALSYPSAAVQEHFRKLANQAIAEDLRNRRRG